MGLEGLDASLMNRFWLTGDLGSVERDYATVRQENSAPAQGAEITGAQPQTTSSDTGLSLLSRAGGDARFRDVFGRAQLLGRRADDSDTQAGATAGSLGFDFNRLADDLAKMSLRRQGEAHDQDAHDAELVRAKDVLKALLSSDEVRMRALENRPLSQTGVLALLNAGLGCLKLLDDGQATKDSLFELVRGDVYDITKPADVLKLTVKMAQKARETFIGAAEVEGLAKAACAKIDAYPNIPDPVKTSMKDHVKAAAAHVIEERSKIAQSLDVSFSLGDGSKESIEKQIKDVREKLRAFRYDLDRIDNTKMGFMEGLRRRFDNFGRSQPTLTSANFEDARKAENDFNALLAHEALSGPDGKPTRLVPVLDHEHLAATTHITHLANNRVRYYFSGKEQNLEAFRQKAHKILEKGGSRTLQFEVGADAKFKADVGFATADIKAGGRYRYTTEVFVDPHTREVTVTVSHGGQLFADAKADLGLNDGDLAQDWNNDARSGKNVLGGSVGANASLGVSRQRTVKYRSVDDFIASLGGESSVLTRTPYSTMACLGKIGGFFKMLGRGVMAGLTATGFRIHKSREDNAAYAAEMRRLNLMDGLNTLIAHRENAIRTQNGTSWKFEGSAGINGSLNVGSFGGTEEVENPDTGVEEERVKKKVGLEVGAALQGTYGRTFGRTATDRRTHLDTARGHSVEWLQERVGAWYDGVAAAPGETKGEAARRTLEKQLQMVEDEIALVPEKTEADWKKFAGQLGVLALRLAYVEKMGAADGLDTSLLAERLVNPHVSIPSDIYDTLMQDVTNVSHTGTHQTTVDFSVNWSVGAGDWLDNLSEGAGEKASASAGKHGITGTANKIVKDGASDVVSNVGGEFVGTLVPTECTIKGTYTYTTPAEKTSVCAWGNGSSHSWSIALSPGLTTRALVEFLAVKLADVNAKDGPNALSSVKAVGVEAAKDWWGAIQESLGIASLENVWDKTMGELAKVSPKIASLLNAPLTGAGTGLDASVDTDYYKRMTFTVAGGRLAEISVDDYVKVGSQIGVRVGVPVTGLASSNVSVGVHMKETLTTVEVDRAVLVRPSLNGLMGKAEAFLRQGDRAGFTGLLAYNAPGALRLWRALSGHLGDEPSPGLVADRKAALESLDEALTILRHIPSRVDEETADRALELQERLLNAYEALKSVPNDDTRRAEQIDALADFAWVMTESFTFARELGGFSRDAGGNLVMDAVLPKRGTSWTAKVDATSVPDVKAPDPSKVQPPPRPPRSDLEIAQDLLGRNNVQIRQNAGGGSCFFYSAIQQVNNPNYPETVEGAIRMRQDFIAHSRQLLADLGTDHAPLGLRREDNSYLINTGRGELVVTDGVDLVRSRAFEGYASYADVSHGAFLADFLGRPVKIVTAEYQDVVTFDRNLRTNQPLTGDPIIIFYNRGQTGLSGHFRAVEAQQPQQP